MTVTPAEPPVLPAGTLDVHAHLLPERLVRAVLRVLSSGGYPVGEPEVLLADDVADALDAAGAAGYTTLLYAHRAGMARALNAWGTAFARTRPGRVAVFAAVHQDDDDPRGVVEDAFADGAWGVKLHAQVQDVDPADPRLAGVFAACADAGRPVLLHGGSAPAPGRHTGTGGATAVLARHPELRLGVAHLGAHETAGFVELARRYPNVMLDTSAVALLAPELLDRVADLAAAGRVAFGSDLPWPAGTLAETAAAVRRAYGEASPVWRDAAVAWLGPGAPIGGVTAGGS